MNGIDLFNSITRIDDDIIERIKPSTTTAKDSHSQKKTVRRFLPIAFVAGLILVATIFIVVHFIINWGGFKPLSFDNRSFALCPIEYSSYADPLKISDVTQWEYDLDQLQKTIDEDVKNNPVYCYGNDKKISFTGLSLLGFTEDDYQCDEGTTHVYTIKENGKTLKRLIVDDYGSFNYHDLMESSSTEEVTFSYEDTYEIAKERFEKLGISFAGVQTVVSFNKSYSESSEGTLLLSRGAFIAACEFEGRRISGNQAVYCEINGKQNNIHLMNKTRVMTSRMPAELISINEALEKIQKKECQFGYEEITFRLERITIERVELNYYQNVIIGQPSVIQPVYVFYGKMSGGENSIEFSCMVQANRIS